MMDSIDKNLVINALFVVEALNLLAHLPFLLRNRLMPRKDVVEIRPYFLVEIAASVATYVLYTGPLRWLLQWMAGWHVLQHLYYFLFWEKSAYAKRIVDWSSLDWFQSEKNDDSEVDTFLVLAMDAFVHGLNVYCLYSLIDQTQLLTLCGVAVAAFAILFFNPSLPWASPANRHLPAWIQRRIAALPVDKPDDVEIEDHGKRS